MLDLRGVTRVFGANGRQVRALQPIDLSVAEGQFVSIVGPSGCGKSTLLNIIAGLDRADAGEVLLDGRPVTGPGVDRVVVFQEAALFPWLSARRNVEFGLKVAGVGPSERARAAQAGLKMVHLSRFADAFPHELSGGMRQRVAIARALALDPRVLLMDEPFAALDSQTRALLHKELELIWAETHKTVIFVTHNVREAVYLSDRVLVMSARPGRLLLDCAVPVGRPRDSADPSLAYLEKQIMDCLRAEIDKVAREEFDSDWEHEKDSLLPPPSSDLGSNI